MPGGSEGDNMVPGMLFVMVSFTPWMIYWTLCGIDTPLGVSISLLIS
ncbi:MAG: hypothetical protein QXX48_02675 [Candidatus Korarchaeum sp.]